ncbi:VOC family protein [Zunongwangia sp. F363]|uniref:VOC family protein n=1 Tax=Autumnicola tepida TaxID=3075595 RepID=A0ABU3C507_9FLAO|nr:VOC family protein [Zunongwangia sp. F363]MDT0641409.1 VOC family protein [Zunongwangia sp. F363]
MKKVIILGFILMSINMNAQSGFNFKKDHDALMVNDVDASAEFYMNILGLPEIPNGGLGDHIRWVELNDKVQIHLIESEEQVEKNKGVHLAINTNNLEGFMNFLKSKDVHFENWAGEAGTTNTRPDGVKQIYLQDPDGYWIEVNDGKLK